MQASSEYEKTIDLFDCLGEGNHAVAPNQLTLLNTVSNFQKEMEHFKNKENEKNN